MVADYSDKHFAIGDPSLPDVLKLRMEEMGLSLAKIAKLIGVSPIRMQSYLTGTKH